MPDLLVLFLAACGTALATGLGAIPVWFLGARAAALTPFLLGIAAGVMGVASIVGLLLPAADEGSVLDLLAGLALGAVLLGVARRRLDTESVFMGRSGPGARTSALVFAVLFVHSLPEGLAVGTAFASERAGLSLFVIVAIAIQNIPEGTSVAIPMEATGYGRARQFWAAVGTSAPQPVGAVVAYLAVEQVNALLPLSFAFAAGAMLSLIVVELLPQAYADRRHWPGPTLGIALGAAVMLVLDLLLGV
jgi:zinc transporter, ZIP family